MIFLVVLLSGGTVTWYGELTETQLSGHRVQSLIAHMIKLSRFEPGEGE